MDIHSGHYAHVTRHLIRHVLSMRTSRRAFQQSRAVRYYSGGLTETWANRRGLGAASAQVPRVAVRKCSVAFVSARPSEEVAGREERRTMIGHVRSEGSTDACGGTRIPRGSLTRLKSQKWWRESWALPGDAETWSLRYRLCCAGGRGPRVVGELHCRRERAACRGRTPLPEGEGRVSLADSTAGGRGPPVVGRLRCRRERAECRGRTPLPEGDGRVLWADSTVGGRAACRGRTPLPEGDGRVSWADSTAGGRGPSVVGGLHCRRERAECRGRTPLPEGEGRVSWADSTAGGRGPCVVGGLRCQRERAACRGRTPLPEGDVPRVMGGLHCRR